LRGFHPRDNFSETILLRVLHVVESLDRGAVEKWLLRMLERARQKQANPDWTFYCVLGQAGACDRKARMLGAHVLHSPYPLARKVEFVQSLRQQLRTGRYDVLHCHHDILSAMYLTASLGIPLHRRIVHVHNADESIPSGSPLKQRVIREPMRLACLQFADQIVGISNHTLDTFLAGRERRPERDLVHYYGVDPTAFANARADRSGFRRQVQLPEDARIILFAGRMVPEKNPVFAVEVLKELSKLDPSAIAVFAGSGSEERRVRERAMELGIADSVRLLGWRSDLPEIMSCCDWFILPRPEAPPEGFGLAVVEAQLAGLRMLLSRGVLDAPLLPTACFRRLALADGPQVWARSAMELLEETSPSRTAAIAALKESPMDMDRAVKALLQLYE
jgi:glycosyltransferase EpsF